MSQQSSFVGVYARRRRPAQPAAQQTTQPSSSAAAPQSPSERTPPHHEAASLVPVERSGPSDRSAAAPLELTHQSPPQPTPQPSVVPPPHFAPAQSAEPERPLPVASQPTSSDAPPSLPDFPLTHSVLVTGGMADADQVWPDQVWIDQTEGQVLRIDTPLAAPEPSPPAEPRPSAPSHAGNATGTATTAASERTPARPPNQQPEQQPEQQREHATEPHQPGTLDRSPLGTTGDRGTVEVAAAGSLAPEGAAARAAEFPAEEPPSSAAPAEPTAATVQLSEAFDETASDETASPESLASPAAADPLASAGPGAVPTPAPPAAPPRPPMAGPAANERKGAASTPPPDHPEVRNSGSVRRRWSGAEWEVDALDIPPRVAELFFEPSFFRTIAEQMGRAVRSGLGSVLVTSVGGGEGRSTVAIGTAIAAAANGSQVALIDADLESPSQADELRLDFEADWIQAVRHDQPLESVSILSLDDGVTLIPLSAPPAGMTPADASDLDRLVERLKGCFDLILFDAPPIHSWATARLAGAVDSCLLVRDTRSTSKSEAALAADRLRRMGVSGLGVVDNFCQGPSND